MNPLFQGAQANDAKDLVNFIIMTLHEELNKIDKKNIQPILNNNFIINQTNQQEIFKYFLENFMRENKSIISDIFYGATHTITQCTGCPYIKHNFESIFFLIFPLIATTYESKYESNDDEYEYDKCESKYDENTIIKSKYSRYERLF